MPINIRAITTREPLAAQSRVSKLTRVEFERHPYSALLKEPANFWDDVFIANEAQVLERVTHPRIRRKLSYDSITHRLFLEYVEGETLDELARQGATQNDPARTHGLLQSLAETVADMHAGVFCGQPLVHNDLKCGNVLVPSTAPNETLLIDFSHAYFDGNLPSFLTNKKEDPKGTVLYSAPEKWDGDFTQGFKSDVFAFGVTAYYACTGKYPFEGTAAEIERAMQEGRPAAPLTPGHKLLRTTADVIMSCLEKNPKRRPTMERVARDFAETAELVK